MSLYEYIGLTPVTSAQGDQATNKKFLESIKKEGIEYLGTERVRGLASYETGLKEYRNKNWNSAMIQFKKVPLVHCIIDIRR